MPKEYPECPLYNPNNCREMLNPKICAIAREDRECLKKRDKPKSKCKKTDGKDLGEWSVPDEVRDSM